MGNTTSQPDEIVAKFLPVEETPIVHKQGKISIVEIPIVETPKVQPEEIQIEELPQPEETPIVEVQPEVQPEETPIVEEELPQPTEEEIYKEKVKHNYQHYFNMFNGGTKAPTGNKSYDEYIKWRFWKIEYERLINV